MKRIPFGPAFLMFGCATVLMMCGCDDDCSVTETCGECEEVLASGTATAVNGYLALLATVTAPGDGTLVGRATWEDPVLLDISFGGSPTHGFGWTQGYSPVVSTVSVSAGEELDMNAYRYVPDGVDVTVQYTITYYP